MHSPRILLIECTGEYRDTVREFFTHKGCTVYAADNAATAQTMLALGEVDLILLDAGLRVEEMYDVSGLLLARQLATTIPKIILTCFPTEALRRQAYGTLLDDLPPHSGFVAKQQGLYALLEAARLALDAETLALS